MASSPECITWMVVGLTESVAIITLNSLTVIAFCRDRNLRKRSTYLVINLAVADMISGGTSTLDLFYNVGAICNFWRYNILSWYQIPQVLHLWFPIVSLTNMTVISLERLNATFWPFRHRTIKKSVYWVLIIAIWLTALLFSCALIMIQYYTRKWDYYYYAWSSFIFICLLVICVSYVLFFQLSFALEISLDTMARQIGKGNWPLRSSPWLLSLSPIVRIPDFRRALKMLCRQRPHRRIEIFPFREINPQNWI